MPTYEYLREDGTKFETFQGINDDPLEECPTTGQKVKRVITGGAGVVYKGDGFYVNDYKNDGKKAAVNGEPESSSEKKETSTKAETDKDTKKDDK